MNNFKARVNKNRKDEQESRMDWNVYSASQDYIGIEELEIKLNFSITNSIEIIFFNPNAALYFYPFNSTYIYIYS